MVHTTQKTKRRSGEKPAWDLPLDAGPNCVGFRVRMLSRVVSAIYDEEFAPLKLRVGQFNILGVLRRRGPLAASDLCRMVMMEKSTASRNLQRMRRRGWVSVAAAARGPGREVSLTGQGLRMLRTAYPVWRRAQEEATRRLGTEGLQALQTVLERMKR